MQNMSFLSGTINSASPLSIYLSLKVHSETRSRKPVEMLHTLALGISYGKVLTIEHNFAHTVAQAARDSDDRVCPSNLRRNIFTVAGLDNIDHNLSSRTATSSFHGTGISIFQFPSVENPGEVQKNIKINSLRITNAHNELSLPRSYTFVPPLEKTWS